MNDVEGGQPNNTTAVHMCGGTVTYSPDYKSEPRSVPLVNIPYCHDPAAHAQVDALLWLLAEARWYAEQVNGTIVNDYPFPWENTDA